METQKFQLHLASKVTVPPAPKPAPQPGEAPVSAVQDKPRIIEIPGMSNRAVRYRVLDAIKVQKLEANAAKMVTPDATIGELRTMQLLYGVYEMVYQVSDPTDDPSQLDPKKGWRDVNSNDFITSDSPLYGPKIFTTKDLALLKQEYRKHHEMSQQEFDALTVGKAIPLADTEG